MNNVQAKRRRWDRSDYATFVMHMLTLTCFFGSGLVVGWFTH